MGWRKWLHHPPQIQCRHSSIRGYYFFGILFVLSFQGDNIPIGPRDTQDNKTRAVSSAFYTSHGGVIQEPVVHVTCGLFEVEMSQLDPIFWGR